MARQPRRTSSRPVAPKVERPLTRWSASLNHAIVQRLDGRQFIASLYSYVVKRRLSRFFRRVPNRGLLAEHGRKFLHIVQRQLARSRLKLAKVDRMNAGQLAYGDLRSRIGGEGFAKFVGNRHRISNSRDSYTKSTSISGIRPV